MSDPRQTLDDAIEFAAGDLPDGFNIVLSVERHAATVQLESPAGGYDTFDIDPELGIADAVCDAVEAAFKYQKEWEATQ